MMDNPALIPADSVCAKARLIQSDNGLAGCNFVRNLLLGFCALCLTGCGSSNNEYLSATKPLVTSQPNSLDYNLYANESIAISRNVVDGSVKIMQGKILLYEIEEYLLQDFEVFEDSGVAAFLFYSNKKNKDEIASRFFLHKLDLDTGEYLAFNLPTFSSIDSDYYIDYVKDKDGVLVCSQNSCVAMDDNGVMENFPIAPEGAQISDLNYGNHAIKLIYRLSLNNNVELYGRSVTRSGEVIDEVNFQDDSCVPFIKHNNTFDCLPNEKFLTELYSNEFYRRKNYGNLDLGVNNTLGRVAWSQVYYLTALNDFLGWGNGLLEANDWNRSHHIFISQLNSLCDLLLTEDGPFLNSTRYSVDDEELLFLLHVSLVYLALSEVNTHLLISDPTMLLKLERSLQVLENIVLDSDKERDQKVTLESLEKFEFEQGRFLTLRFKQGFPFWADGANVPHNFVSSYITARLHAEGGVTETSRELIEGLVSLTQLNDKDSWVYWSGLGETGWETTDNVSENTPTYAGSKRTAPIGYRTNDAKSILIACSYNITAQYADSSCHALVAHIRNLVERGYLLPSLNKYLCEISGCVVTKGDKYRISSYAHEIQDQFWYYYAVNLDAARR